MWVYFSLLNHIHIWGFDVSRIKDDRSKTFRVSSFIVKGIDSAATLRTLKCAFVGVEIGVALLTTEQRHGAGLARISEVQPFLFSRKANPAVASSAPLFYLKNLEKQ